jgi:hypothetical protein
MKKAARRVFWVLWMVLAGALPAYANNPPGILSILLIFPVAILAYRLAGAKLTEKERKWRFLSGLGLAVCFFLTLGGTGIAVIPLLILLFYGMRRGALACARGQGWKRFVFGPAVIIFTILATGNYLSSLNARSYIYIAQGRGAQGLRDIVGAEENFRSTARLDADKNGLPEYGSADQLRAAGLARDQLSPSASAQGYRFVIVITGNPAQDEKQFFAYATPVNYAGRDNLGISLLDAIRSRPKAAWRTFATDESGEVRDADLGTSREVTREETQKWQKAGPY